MSRSGRSLTALAALTVVGVAMLPGAAGAAALPAAAPEQVAGGDTSAGAPALSYTGRYLAYVSVQPDQTPRRQRIVRLDLSSGRSELLNPSIDGGVARGNFSFPPVLSSDGSRVAFTTNGSRLVPDDTNGRFDAFVRDASTNTTLLASAASDGGVANGSTGMASLSKDGRYVVFTSTSTDVVPGSVTTNSDVYRRDLTSQTTVQITVRPDGSPSIGPGSASTDISADGNLVAFTSYSTDLVPGDTDQEADLFVRNMTSGTTRWLTSGIPAGANPGGVVISPDGRWVSTRWDDGSLRLTRVSTATTSLAVANGYASIGSFSRELGRFVFVSGGQPWVRDLASGVNTAIPAPVGGTVSTVTISGDGRFAAYDWAASDVSPSLVFRIALT